MGAHRSGGQAEDRVRNFLGDNYFTFFLVNNGAEACSPLGAGVQRCALQRRHEARGIVQNFR